MSIQIAQNTRVSKRIRPNLALVPDVAWNGTAGSGGTAPAENTALLGSGFTGKAIARFDQVELLYMTGELSITVGVDHADDAWIKEVEFWVEGATGKTTLISQNPQTGTIGHTVVIDDLSMSTEGDFDVYAYVRPYNGYEKRLGPIRVIRRKDASRDIRWVSPSGSDSNSGLSSASPWKTLLFAGLNCPEGSIIYCAAGTYIHDPIPATLRNNVLPIEFRRAPGLTSRSDVVITRSGTVPNDNYDPRLKHVIWRGLTIAMENWSGFSGPSPTGTYTFRDCDIIDRTGVFSGTDVWPGVGEVQIGRQIGTQAVQFPFNPSDGQRNSMIDCKLEMYVGAGWHLARNVDMIVAADGFYFGGLRMPAIFDVRLSQVGDGFHQRRHLANTLTVATVTYEESTTGLIKTPDSQFVPGKTTITWNEATTYDQVVAPGQANQDFMFLSGPLAGQRFGIASQSTAGVTVLYGDLRALQVGNAARGWIIFHADALQLGRQTSPTETNSEGLFVQRLKAVGETFQVLWQAGDFAGTGTISTVGTALTCSVTHNLQKHDFVRMKTGAQQSDKYRRVVSTPTSTTAVLSDPFPADLVNEVNWRQVKTITNSAVQLSIFHRLLTPGVLNQFQNGHEHFVWRQNTVRNQEFVLTVVLNQSAFGMDHCLFVDNVLHSISWASTEAAPVDYGLEVLRNHFTNPTSNQRPGTDSTSGPLTYDADYRLTSTGVRTTTPKILFNYKGEKITAPVKVGALG